MAHFLEGVGHAQGDGRCAVGAAVGEAVVEFFLAGWHDEEIDEGLLNLRIRAITDLIRALNVDVHDDIGSGPEVGNDLGLQRAVEVFMDDGVFEKMASSESLFEIRAGEEMIVLAVFLAGTWRTGGAGYGIVDLARVGQFSAKRGFSRARGAGNDKEDAGACGHWVRM